MTSEPTTLNALVAALESAGPDDAAVFSTSAGDIGGGYHVTELKLVSIASIDCGGRMDNWTETHLQLLDGHGGARMSVGKFIGIARHSAKKLPELADAPLFVEFAPRNDGLRRYRIDAVSSGTNRVQIALREDAAVCKPMQEQIDAAAVPSGRSNGTGQTAGCC